MPSLARKNVNRIVSEFAKEVKGKILFVGVNRSWDNFYQEIFRNEDFKTMDINPKVNPNIIGDIQNCPEIPDKTYDGILLIGVYEYLLFPLSAIKEIHRILKSEGKVLFCLPGPAFYKDKPTLIIEEAIKWIKPFLLEKMEITYNKTGNIPYYIYILAKKNEQIL